MMGIKETPNGIRIFQRAHRKKQRGHGRKRLKCDRRVETLPVFFVASKYSTGTRCANGEFLLRFVEKLFFHKYMLSLRNI